jgi:hypothetical protein
MKSRKPLKGAGSELQFPVAEQSNAVMLCSANWKPTAVYKPVGEKEFDQAQQKWQPALSGEKLAKKLKIVRRRER